MFRPCIDLHEGKVKQLVGGTLSNNASQIKTNFVAQHSAGWYAELYKKDNLPGGHVIMLGPGNEAEARAALRTYPGGLQIGGGINAQNAREWLDAGASHVIVTSWVFREGRVDWERLKQLNELVGQERLVIDLSCRRRDNGYFVVTDRWQKFTEVKVNVDSMSRFAQWCSEFLIHAVDVEGLCSGIDQELVAKLGDWVTIPTTYAGGATSLGDLELVTKLGRGKIDLTIGSALDIFGGSGVRYQELIEFNRRLSNQ